MAKRILVTGGTGLVGRALQDHVRGDPEYFFVSSVDCDLRDAADTMALFERIRPWGVVHLAAVVGGVFANRARPFDFAYDNSVINANVVGACHRLGVERLVCVLSTCVFPDSDAPFSFEALHQGPPHPSNFGYAFAKRMMETLVRSHNMQYGTRWACIVPANVYGPHDHFGSEQSHVVPALVTQLHNARVQGVSTIVLRGTGNARRQFVYSRDLARIIVQNIRDPRNCVVSGKDEVSIADLVSRVARVVGYTGTITYEGSSDNDGQARKYAIDDSGNRDWTSLDAGLEETYGAFLDQLSRRGQSETNGAHSGHS